MPRVLLAGLLLWVLTPATVFAGHFEVTEIASDLLLLSTDQGSYSNNSLVFTGPDGVLLVDTHSAGDAEALKAFVDSLGLGPPRYIINTHRHVEHIGGNAAWGATPIGVAHELFPSKLRGGSFLFTEYAPEYFPDITFTDSLSITFNGERIRLVSIGGSHDDNEILVHFTGHGLAHVSSVVNGFNFPSVDGDGDALRFAELTERLMTLLPRDVRIVSGHHGKQKGYDVLGTWDQLPAYADMMRETEAIVRRELDAGRSLEQMQEDDVLADYAEYAESYVSTDGWLEYLVDAITVPREQAADICVPIYETWKAEGAAAAVGRYRSLVESAADAYDDNEYILLSIGNKLRARGRYEDALVFLRGSLETYPEAKYTYYTHYLAASCCAELGQKEEAVQHAREALRIEPEFGAAGALVEELTGETEGG